MPQAPRTTPSTPSAPLPVLRLTGLAVTRGGHPILQDVHWTVLPGQHWVLLGANGSGKTSLLAALTGYLTPSAGDVQLLGQTYGQSNWPALRRRIGLVSSALRHLLHEEEPALEIVAAGRQAAIDLRTPFSRTDLTRARHWLRHVGLLHLAHRPWAVLSQGERQRVLIARSLMAQPDLLILDEPCAGLDPVAREHFLQFLAHLGQQPHPALILVTHHVEEIIPAFGHALILRAGRVAAAGPISQALTSATLSLAFDTPLALSRTRSRYHLRLRTGSGDK